VLLLVIWLQRYIQRTNATQQVIEQVESTPTLWGVELPVEQDPTLLAEHGNFAAGIGVLLWLALRSVGWKPEGIGKSQTPREVVRNLSPQDFRLPSLRQLLFLAEKVRFGGIEATQEMFVQAQQWYSFVERGSHTE
jgi:hypothetical protein